MTLDKEENKERMGNRRAAQKEQDKEQERKAIIEGVVAAVGDTFKQIIADQLNQQFTDQLNQISAQRKMSCQEESCQEESFQLAPQTPPRLITGGTRGRSPAMGSGNGRLKATKQDTPAPPTPPTPPTPSSPRMTPSTPPSTPPSLLMTPFASMPSFPLSVPSPPPNNLSPLSPLSPLSFLSELDKSTPAEGSVGLSTAKKLVSELIDLVDDVHKIFQFPTEEEDFMAEKKRYYK